MRISSIEDETTGCLHRSEQEDEKRPIQGYSGGCDSGESGPGQFVWACPMDPRSEDMPEDSPAWLLLLGWAADTHEPYAQALRGMRAVGTRLQRNSKGQYILRPYVHPQHGWLSEKQYEEVRDKWLKKYRANLLEHLSRLSKEPSLLRESHT